MRHRTAPHPKMSIVLRLKTLGLKGEAGVSSLRGRDGRRYACNSGIQQQMKTPANLPRRGIILFSFRTPLAVITYRVVRETGLALLCFMRKMFGQVTKMCFSYIFGFCPRVPDSQLPRPLQFSKCSEWQRCLLLCEWSDFWISSKNGCWGSNQSHDQGFNKSWLEWSLNEHPEDRETAEWHAWGGHGSAMPFSTCFFIWLFLSHILL